ncbi:MAG: hypothetical protein WC975_02905 [Phycisphaerae bacterium]
MRWKFLILAVGFVGLGSLGCQSGSYEYNWRTLRFEQVGPRARYQIDVSHEKKGSAEDEDMGQIPPPGNPSGGELTRKQQSAFAKGRLYRFYLGDQTVDKNASMPELYVVRQTTPDKLAELLSLIYPGQGPGGSDRLRFIIYADEKILEKAQSFASRLDVPAQKNKPENLSDWDLAIGLIYGSEFPRKLDSDARFRIVSMLNRIMDDRSAQVAVRWAAGIIASDLYSRFDPRDSVAASATLSRLSKVVRGQDYKAMVVRYHHLQQLMARGQTLTAKKQAQDALNYFQKWEDTNCYQSIRNIVEQK